MSPASSGNLEVERYIGACLISQNRSKNATAGKVRNEHIFPQNRDHYIPDIYQHHVNFRLQRCQSVDGWAGGMPLISFANHQRRNRRNEADVGANRTEDHHANPLARLAVHTQGAPLILAKSYNHRKNKVHRNNAASTKVFENSNNKKPNKCQEQQNSSGAGVDAVSVTSDESSGSANSENCLPRIIKPRKRRKKDRKPPLLGRPLSQDGFSTDSASPDIDNAQSGVLTIGPFIPFTFDPFPSYRVPESPQLIDRCHILGDISETPKLHHSFEDIEELDDGKDINGNQSTSTCQCRYCDPSGQIWDVDRNCYSPFLTPPNSHSKSFHFPNLNLDVAYSCPVSNSENHCLVHSMSTISLEEEENKKLPPSRSSSSSSCRDLEVSTEIVTSLNGHRDLEIRFFSSPSVDAGARDKDPEKNQASAAELSEPGKMNRCAVNSECKFVSEE
ncbi:uncharacterized protein LOC108903195 [Anoplophora glabripennis]|uniref:uncharacterized protein LOC108903195 n=1 Tax=Anoplophora glabripennis TaxID=217634 RepID=UPI0008759D54|nr:uncharacterized protein LOC108903195 [Anoplophora glabripennis]